MTESLSTVPSPPSKDFSGFGGATAGAVESRIDTVAGAALQDEDPDHRGLMPPRRPSWISPRSDLLLLLCFVIVVSAPLIVFSLGHANSGQALSEKRYLAPVPKFRSEPLKAWPALIEAYYNDHFGLRVRLVRSYNIILHQYLGASNSDALLGKDGWIFYARENIFTDFFGQSQFSADELQRWKEYLEDRRELLARHHAHYLFVIAPDKNTIYPEKLPDYVRRHRGRSRVQQLREYLRASGSPVDVLDLHDALLAAKSHGLLYFPQDTHWNGRGFFVAYLAMCGVLSRWFPEITPQVLERDYTLRQVPWEGGEWGLFGLPEKNLTYPSEFLVPLGTQKARRAPAPVPPNFPPVAEPWNAPLYWEGIGRGALLVFHDSYMRTGALDRNLVPLAEHFARTMLLVRKPSDAEFKEFVDSFHPDVVIEEWAERTMGRAPEHRPSVYVTTSR
jgi:hypothetical protein